LEKGHKMLTLQKHILTWFIRFRHELGTWGALFIVYV